jgi:uncharacterized protein involved in exopolysaccharide biosynthesis
MKKDALEMLYAKLRALHEKGDETEAQKLIGKEFPNLPEDVQGEILARLYFSTLQEQTAQAATIAAVQEKGLEVLDTLDAMEAVLKKDKS